MVKCPKCGKDIVDNSEISFFCSECGYKFNNHKQKKIKVKTQNSIFKKIKQLPTFFKSKKNLAILSVVIIVIFVFILFLNLLKEDGLKIAYKTSEKIGQNIVKVEENAKIHVDTSSECNAINKSADFDYIYESDKKIEVDGVKVPEWIIKFYATDTDITKIYYRDYSLQKKNYKGKKLKEPIEYDDIKECKTLKQIKNKFDIDPISITFYNDNTKEYRYMFYYINSDKDEEVAEFIITFDKKDKVIGIIENDINNIFIY